MKLIWTEDAAGQVLCHDMTQIIKDIHRSTRSFTGNVKRPLNVSLRTPKRNTRCVIRSTEAWPR